MIRINDPKRFFEGLLVQSAKGSVLDEEDVFLKAFGEYLHGRVNEVTAYEYVRVAKKYLAKVYGIQANEDERLRQAIKEFLDIPNPSTYRNTLAGLKHLFKFLSMSEYLQEYKFKACMPSFDISTPSLEDLTKFKNALTSDQYTFNAETIVFYFELAVQSAIRPEHLLRLRKNLFDLKNRQINTWMKTFSKKNFFFSFYTKDFAPKVEKYLSQLPEPDSLLFDMPLRTIDKAFRRASMKCGVHITPKTLRKFTTNHLRRHGMLPEDVDTLTSHLPYSIVARHYLDHSRIREDYDKAMRKVKFP
jgi:integrase